MAVDLGNCRLFEWAKVPTTDETGRHPSFLMAHTVTALGSRLYVVGGMVGLGAARSFTNAHVFYLDVNTHVWRILDVDIPDELPRSRHVAFLVDDKLYVFGGANDEYLSDMWHLDFMDDEWEQVDMRGAVPSPRSNAIGEFVDSMRQLIVFGGVGEGEVVSNELKSFNVESGTWTSPKAKGTAPSARYGHASCSNGRTVFMYGGDGFQSGSGEGEELLPVKFDDMYTLHFAGNVWNWTAVATGSSTPPGRSLCSLSLAAGRIFLYGGRSMESGELSDLYFYDFGAKSFIKIKEGADDKKSYSVQPASMKISHHKAVFSGNKLLVIGGRGAGMQQLELRPKRAA